MAEPTRQHTPQASLADRISRLEERLTAVESRLQPASLESNVTGGPMGIPAVLQPPSTGGRTEDELEFEVGQNWFAKAGVLVLTSGVVFTLSLPYAHLPPAMPSLVGYGLVAGLFLLARLWREPFAMVSGYLRAVGMALLFFATLRLYFFGAHPVMASGTLAGRALLFAPVAANLTLALRWRSPALAGLALALGAVAALAVGSPWFVLGCVVGLGALATGLSLARHWPGLVLAGIILCGLTYFIWAIDDPFLGRPVHFVTAPPIAPAFMLVSLILLALAPFLRRDRSAEDAITNSAALINCGFGYGVFLVHTVAAHPASFIAHQVAASAGLLGLAIAFWVREQSRVSTFLYAMTGYVALSLAIIKAAAVPDVFVWLSLQSVVVVATAIWFRSRFIVVANFVIYAVIVMAYMAVAERESGISIGFGVVALLSARILNWQKTRLELKTELMRNAYLLSAFVIFPYALYHLVPARSVGLAWIGLALFYYLLNVVVRSQKFRWMGHSTLLLTTLYLVIVATSRFEPVYRVLTFLVLGTVLLMVSLSFTRLRHRQRARPAPPTAP